MVLKKRLKRRRGQSGQAISEYAAIIAFVAVIVLLCFSFQQGRLSYAVSAAFGSAANSLNGLASAPGSLGGSLP